MIGIPKGFKKTEVRRTTAEIPDEQGYKLSKGQRFFVLEMRNGLKRPTGEYYPVNIAIDNGFDDDSMFPMTTLSEIDFYNSTEVEVK